VSLYQIAMCTGLYGELCGLWFLLGFVTGLAVLCLFMYFVSRTGGRDA